LLKGFGVLGGEQLKPKVTKESGDGGSVLYGMLVCLKWGFLDVEKVAIWFIRDSTCCWFLLACRRLVQSKIQTVQQSLNNFR